jgi:spermidine/putrescine transport system substrate-binding protein
MIFLWASTCLVSCSKNERQLHLYCWSSYIKPELIERFEQEFDCQVILDTFDSNESMYTKLRIGHSGYDIIVPSSYFIPLLESQNLLEPIDWEKVPNAQHLDRNWLASYNISATDKSMPYMMSITGLAYRKDKLSLITPSWRMLERRDLKGRMTMLNDIREVFGAALKALGFSANTLDEAEIKQAENLIISWKANLAKFESEQYKNGVASAEYLLVQGYSGDILQVMEENEEVQFLIPLEGTTISCDHLVIPKGAPQKELAEAFLNFLYDPEVAAENMEYLRYFSPNQAAYPLLNEALKNSPSFFLPKFLDDKSEVIEDIGPHILKYSRAWDRVKAAL